MPSLPTKSLPAALLGLAHSISFMDSIPFYLLHGLDPILPFNLFEATHLVEGFYSGMTSQHLLALCIRQLEKRPDDIDAAFNTLYKSHLRSKAQFEKKYTSQVEKELDQKSKPRYLGPYEVVRRTQGGSYVLKEMDGTISARGVAAFRLIPYYARHLPSSSTTMENSNEESSDDEEIQYDSDDSQ